MIDLPYAEVIGDPIAHSKSPLIHRFWLDALGIDAEYRATHVYPGQLGAYLANRRDDSAWRGCNVTIPHKIAVLDHVGDPGGLRSSIGAANCVYRDASGGWIATNTDVAGFLAPIAALDLADMPVAVVGTGGAARAVLFALAAVGTGPVTILARDPAKAAALLATFGLPGGATAIDASLPGDTGLLVNASSLGMTGQPTLSPDLASLPAHAVVYDLVYAPVVTALLASARARGLTAVDGLAMLVGQAAAAFELFFGVAAPRKLDDDLRALLVR